MNPILVVLKNCVVRFYFGNPKENPRNPFEFLRASANSLRIGAEIYFRI
jgi:hypothetical protein